MPIPASFLKDGFVAGRQARPRMKLKNGLLYHPLLIGTEGETDTGKTEFILSGPGPGMVICLDRAFDPLFDNPNPPISRRDDFAFKAVSVALNMMATQPVYEEYFKKTRELFYAALKNPDALTVGVDGDSDFWELQRLAAFGKLANVWPQTRYSDVYAAKRAMISRAWDSGKTVIATNKIKDEYITVMDPKTGLPKKDDSGMELRQKTGNKERQGFPDQSYLWNIQLRHLREPLKSGGHKYGIRILKCKADSSMEGMELWGSDCNYAGLVQTVYPHINPKEFGI